jgi:hypothetical protein
MAEDGSTLSDLSPANHGHTGRGPLRDVVIDP